jgi:hypothetical protein
MPRFVTVLSEDAKPLQPDATNSTSRTGTDRHKKRLMEDLIYELVRVTPPANSVVD